MTEASVPTGPHTGRSVDADLEPTPREATPREATPRWLAIAIVVVFGVLYAYDVWEAIGNLVGLNLYAGGLGIAITGSGWALLVAGVAVPFLVFGVALWLGRRRGPLARAALLLVGFAVVQVLSADLSSLFELGGLDLS